MRTAIRRTAPAALAIGALALTAACGGSADAEDKDGAKPAPAAKSEPKPLTQAQVDRAVLTVDDLPGGWAADDSDDDSGSDDSDADDSGDGVADDIVADDKKCQPLLDSVGFAHDADTETDADASFSKGEMGPFMMTAVGAFTPKEAKQLLAPAKVPAGCDTFTAKDADLGKVEVAYQRASAPDLGDESRASRFTLTSLDDKDMPPMQMDVAGVRVDGAVVAMVQASVLGPDADGFDKAIRTAVAKLEKAAKGPAKDAAEGDKV
ncbi:hypothetical protein [Streptomyces boninensis]|uniref:hypothetical protein n=1 Tax=Streptomyces boninensis TaxID=2039455 RepID=UPI003B223C75